MQRKEEQIPVLLQKKPQRQTGLRRMPVLILLGVIVILGGAFVGAWRVYTINSTSTGTRSPEQIKGSTGKGGNSNGQAPWDTYPNVYWQTLRAQFAQGLHMTEQQIRGNLQSTFLATHTPTNNEAVEFNSADASQWLNNLAKTQHISQNQLHTIETTAIQRAHAVLVQQHVLTQQQADETIRGMNQDDLNIHIMEAFYMCSQGKKSCEH